MQEVFLGIDFATQSSRAVLIDTKSKIYARISRDLAPVVRGDDGRLTQDTASWTRAIDELLQEIIGIAKEQNLVIAGMCISATSGTFVVTSQVGIPIAPAAMYNDGRASNPLARAKKIIEEVGAGQYLFAHTPEFLVAHLTGAPLPAIATDWSHALKTGVDLNSQQWNADAEEKSAVLSLTLPAVVAPGTLLGTSTLGDIPIYAGMTDGCTAQISVGSTSVGSAVSTLGTTLVLKVVGDTEISGPGFYSHLLPTNRWLAGAASNLGGISFEKYKSEIKDWDSKAAAHGPATFATYPLVAPGERFPIANSTMSALSSGVARDDVDQYRAILEGIAFAERLAYETLSAAGAVIKGAIFTVGGGSRSLIWSSIRATILQRPIAIVENSGSDIGAAMIATAAHNSPDIASGLDIFNSSITQAVEVNPSESDALESRYQEFLTLVQPFQNAGSR